ncbi:MAG: hypothetical protein K1X74_05970 [Pirellulales bacterium]|nr:hypothetical protein [Pirellulales bacterium]
MKLRVLLWAGLLLGTWQSLPVAADDLEAALNAKRIEAAERLRQDNEAKMAAIRARLDEVRQWTQVQFQLAERDEIDKPRAVARIVEQWQKHRENEIFQLLQFPEKNRGAIESGRALNALLAQIGPAAYQNELNRRANPDYAVPLSAHTQTEIPEDVVAKLSHQTKTLGPKAVGRFNEPPIDVDWPVELRDEPWQEHRAAIEAARAKLLVELGSGRGVSPELDAELRRSVAALNAAFSEYRRAWAKAPREPGIDQGLKYRQICDGQRHIEKLICTVYQLISAGGSTEVLPAETFKSGNVEALLAYLQRNNLELATPAKATDRDAYYKVFNLMVWYYLDQSAATRAEQALETQLAALEGSNQEATNLILGKTLTASEQTALMIEELKFVRALIDDE